MVETIHVLIGMMAVAWLAAASILVVLWREVRAMSEVVEEQRTMWELRVMRMRYRRLGPDVDPVILQQTEGDGDGEHGGRGGDEARDGASRPERDEVGNGHRK